ncbi:hypothetical protein [uncultured Hymenobacter sp.]|uniref:hypothetical protein n=1 Tax=uncultured Hymenobacter sp. TaxID=170016 RepID=UPI0035CA70F3
MIRFPGSLRVFLLLVLLLIGAANRQPNFYRRPFETTLQALKKERAYQPASAFRFKLTNHSPEAIK